MFALIPDVECVFSVQGPFVIRIWFFFVYIVVGEFLCKMIEAKRNNTQQRKSIYKIHFIARIEAQTENSELRERTTKIHSKN